MTAGRAQKTAKPHAPLRDPYKALCHVLINVCDLIICLEFPFYEAIRIALALVAGADRTAALRLALREIVRERLRLVDRLLLALRVVRVDDGRRRVTGRLTPAEA